MRVVEALGLVGAPAQMDPAEGLVAFVAALGCLVVVELVATAELARREAARERVQRAETAP